MKKFLFVILAIVTFFVVIFVYSTDSTATPIKTPPSGEVILGGKVFSVIIRDTNKGREEGLSRWVSLPDNQGMLFVFTKQEILNFWMKDMLFSIDIIWMDSDLKITHIEKSVSPDTYPKIFRSEVPSLYVLEITAGQSEKLNLKIGNILSFVKK